MFFEVKATVACFGAMRDYLPESSTGNTVTLELETDSTAGDAVDRLGAPRKLVFALLVDGERATLETMLHDGAQVTLMPPFAGGRR